MKDCDDFLVIVLVSEMKDACNGAPKKVAAAAVDTVGGDTDGFDHIPCDGIVVEVVDIDDNEDPDDNFGHKVDDKGADFDTYGVDIVGLAALLLP